MTSFWNDILGMSSKARIVILGFDLINTKINYRTFRICIELIAQELSSVRIESYPYVISLFEYCQQFYPDWYKTDLSIQILIGILSNNSFVPWCKCDKCVILSTAYCFVSNFLGSFFSKL